MSLASSRPPVARPSRAVTVAKVVGFTILRALWLSTMVLTPLFGFWLASSLAAYKNASQLLSLLLGLALFPLLPVGWELFSAWRRTKREAPRKQILTRLDRLVLRTLAINGVFLAVMLWTSKATAFRALAVRGDWMVDGHDGAVASTIRGVLLGIADKLDHGKPIDDDGGSYGQSDHAPDPWDIKREDEPAPIKPGDQTPPKTAAGWPLDESVDPKVSAMPEAAQASIATVGAYLKEQFPDKKQRVKAIHDFVALRMTYDDDTLKAIEAHDYANVPSQEAEPVFARKKAVCAGYAKLMTAIGAAANIELKYITGYIRDSSRRVAAGSDDSVKAALQGYRHAWNAVLIDEEWFLVDTTWDDHGTDGKVRSTYLFAPPKLFAYDHLPEDQAWQLTMKPLSPGEFARQPILSPEIGRFGLTLESPTRSQVSVSGELSIVLDNPYDARLLASAQTERAGTELPARGSRSGRDCKVATTNHKTTITCELGDGEWEVTMFAAPSAPSTEGHYGYIGTILANSR